MNLIRGTSTAATGGLANPIFAALELLVAVTLSVLAISVPIAAGVVVIGIFGFSIYKLWRFFDANKNRTATSSKST
jgi:hypothetical protein